jgi:hypothetical protein
VITPVKSYTTLFTSDGTSQTYVLDCSLTPVDEDFSGAQPIAVLTPVVTSAYTGALSGVTTALSGTTITFTFTSAPPKNDNNGNLIVYTLTFLLQYQT